MNTNASNPLSADEIRHYADVLAKLLRSLGGEIVSTALVGKSETDLLGSVGHVSDRFSELLDFRVGRSPETSGDLSRGLEILNRVENEFSAAGHAHGPSVEEVA